MNQAGASARGRIIVRWLLLPGALSLLAACFGGRSSLLDDGTDWLGAGDGTGDGMNMEPVDPPHDEPCGQGLRGPWMVPIPVPGSGSFCIDSTEVTRHQYAAFLAARFPIAAQPSYCGWNDTYVPFDWDLQQRDDVPATMDWCDARAYCTWAGKRLCGRIGGGTIGLSSMEFVDPDRDEWGYACTAGGQLVYPYGDTYSPTACVTDSMTASRASPVKSAPGCVGGFPGLYDMSGNVYEWEDAADQNVGPGDSVGLRGGGWNTGYPYSACLSPEGRDRDYLSWSIGVRCCKDAPP